MPKGSRFPRFARVRIRFGAPIQFSAREGKPGREEYAAAAHEIMRAIAALAEGEGAKGIRRD